MRSLEAQGIRVCTYDLKYGVRGPGLKDTEELGTAESLALLARRAYSLAESEGLGVCAEPVSLLIHAALMMMMMTMMMLSIIMMMMVMRMRMMMMMMMKIMTMC